MMLGQFSGWLNFAPGFLGIDVFFVVSGFHITTLLIDEWQRRGVISLVRFYARRALRLLPRFVVSWRNGVL